MTVFLSMDKLFQVTSPEEPQLVSTDHTSLSEYMYRRYSFISLPTKWQPGRLYTMLANSWSRAIYTDYLSLTRVWAPWVPPEPRLVQYYERWPVNLHPRKIPCPSFVAGYRWCWMDFSHQWGKRVDYTNSQGHVGTWTHNLAIMSPVSTATLTVTHTHTWNLYMCNISCDDPRIYLYSSYLYV